MQKFIDWMEVHFAPPMNKVNRNVWVLTLKDSIMQVLPMILVGSLVTVLSILKNFLPWFPNLSTISSYTMGLLSVFIAFLIPFNYMEKKKINKMRLIAGMSGIALFMIIVKLQEVSVLQFKYFGAGGMFVSIIAGIYVAFIMGIAGRYSFFKQDSAIPDFVRVWFDAIIPILVVTVTGWLAVYVLQLDLYQILLNIFMPITSFAQTLPGFLLITFLGVFLYSMGISGWVLFPITKPIFLAGITANMAAVAAGGVAKNIVTAEVLYSGWVAIGGIGATLPLVIMLVRSKSKRLKALGSASLVPGIFNINEPVIFGAVAWNPILMVPLWLQGIILPLITYVVLDMGVVNIPAAVFDMWYCPFPISTWIVSQDLSGLVLFAVVATVSTLIWYPFFKMYEKQQVESEAAAS
ncbi:PTS transporter subunit EIIC [Raoultella sp. WB_B2P2-3]|jgi:PTS system cellobiose-specific IIC component|uniref:PTS sugar transporter subunit IIC n=1 Tax=Raoultella TaxID=160674 RepID=UPI000BA2C500|nr:MULTISPECIES: PTS transporter subunit EIIC [Enterobacteriaceae]MVT01326.1 PTS sugar transporter subunit IIC [Raoultella sp. 10-1]PAC13878.1 protein-N(pi)-phosphohistidine--sugar phosphotransferase [Enterobacter sp. 10-1]